MLQGGEEAVLDLRTLVRPKSPNHYLVAPAGYGGAAADTEAPRFALAPAELAEVVRRVALGERRTALVGEARERLAIEVVQRTPVLRFPDSITIEVLPSEDGGATLALYSRSRYGYGDFGVNRRRVERWLGLIAQAVADRLAR
jgi:uncharacterized protein (DUF1499 family)